MSIHRGIHCASNRPRVPCFSVTCRHLRIIFWWPLVIDLGIVAQRGARDCLEPDPDILERVAKRLRDGRYWGMKAYSPDLRRKIVQAVDSGLPQQEVADRFGVSVATVERYLKLRRDTGRLEPRPIP